MSITFPVALFVQQVNSMRRIMLSAVCCLALPYFSTLSHKQARSLGEKFLNINCVF